MAPRGEHPGRDQPLRRAERADDRTRRGAARLAPRTRWRARGRPARAGPLGRARPSRGPVTASAEDPSATVPDALLAHPAVREVDLVGSRATGTAGPLSDHDFVVRANDVDAVIADLPA